MTSTQIKICMHLNEEAVDGSMAEFKKLVRHFGCVETVESRFGVEFSCGDGKYLSQLDYDSAEFSQYDATVDLRWPVRVYDTGELLSRVKFEEKWNVATDEYIYWLNAELAPSSSNYF